MGMYVTGNGDLTYPECISSLGVGDVPHQDYTSSPARGMCFTGNADSHQKWGCTSPGIGMYLTWNARPHRESGCYSLVMHILTGNAYPHRECTKFKQGDPLSLSVVVLLHCTY